MAGEGSPHAMMAEAFAKRLCQLYPEAEYSEGKKVRSVGLKPDVYVRHPDGRQWAFEMVHGNSHAGHLLENHKCYAQAGIQDVWILWDDLRPGAGRQVSIDQGVMPNTLGEARDYPLTNPHRVILEMQPGDVRHLYAFTIDPLGAGRDIANTALMRAIGVGVHIYRFEGWQGQDRYAATRDYVPMLELEFAPNGSPIAPDRPGEDEMWDSLLARLGLDTSQGIICTEWMVQFERSLAMPETQSLLLRDSVKAYLKRLSPAESAELARCLRSVPAGKLAPPPGLIHSEEHISRALDSVEMAQTLAQDAQRASEHIKGLGLPAPLVKLLTVLMDPQRLSSTAEWMKWQDESETLQKVRAKR